MRQQSQSLPSQVYVSARSKGAPASMYGLNPTQYILSINGHSTLTMDAFFDQIKRLNDGQYVRIKTMSFDGIPCVVSLKMCLHYWPNSLLTRQKDCWIESE